MDEKARPPGSGPQPDDQTTGGAATAESAGLTLRHVLRGFRHDRVTVAALLFLSTLIFLVVFADLLLPHDALTQNLRARLQPPMSTPPEGGFPHVLGTDPLGRDLLARIIHGGRVSMTVGLLSVLLSGIFGVFIGLIAGFYRGRIDTVLSRIVDVMIAFPTFLAAIFVLFLVGRGFWNVILVLALVRWHVYARVTRGLAMSYRESPFIEGARAIGCTDRRLIFRHLVPNLISPILVLATLEVALVIIAEAGLSFLGLGVRPPTPSWGIEIAGSRAYLRDAWWLVTFPGLTIFLTTLSLNLTATWLRTITDPVQRWRWVSSGRRSVAAASEEDL